MKQRFQVLVIGSFEIAFLPLHWISFYDVPADIIKVILILFSRYMDSVDLRSSHCEMDKSVLIINGSSSLTINSIFSRLLPFSNGIYIFSDLSSLKRYVSIWMACPKTWSIFFLSSSHVNVFIFRAMQVSGGRDGIHVLRLPVSGAHEWTQLINAKIHQPKSDWKSKNKNEGIKNPDGQEIPKNKNFQYILNQEMLK